jgi:hypothetical protein
MRTIRHISILALLAVGAVACSDDAPAASVTTVAVSDSTVGATDTTGAVVVDSTQVVSESTVPATVIDGPVQIDVVVGADSGPDRVETVKAGADVTLNITNPNAADEYHVHGIDLEQKADQGVMATMNFTLDTPGTYEVESHVTEEVLLVIEVV